MDADLENAMLLAELARRAKDPSTPPDEAEQMEEAMGFICDVPLARHRAQYPNGWLVPPRS